MKFFVAIFLTALLCFALGLQLPWWFVGIGAFVVAIAIPQKSGKAWLSGFLGVFLLWIILAFVAQQKGGDLIAKQMANLLPLKGNTILLIIITGFIGGLVAGFGALTGSYGRKMLRSV